MHLLGVNKVTKVYFWKGTALVTVFALFFLTLYCKSLWIKASAKCIIYAKCINGNRKEIQCTHKLWGLKVGLFGKNFLDNDMQIVFKICFNVS